MLPHSLIVHNHFHKESYDCISLLIMISRVTHTLTHTRTHTLSLSHTHSHTHKQCVAIKGAMTLCVHATILIKIATIKYGRHLNVGIRYHLVLVPILALKGILCQKTVKGVLNCIPANYSSFCLNIPLFV